MRKMAFFISWMDTFGFGYGPRICCKVSGREEEDKVSDLRGHLYVSCCCR